MTRRCVVRLTLCVTNVAKFNQLLRLLRPSLISRSGRPAGRPGARRSAPGITRPNIGNLQSVLESRYSRRQEGSHEASTSRVGTPTNRNHAKMHAVTASFSWPRRVKEAGRL